MKRLILDVVRILLFALWTPAAAIAALAATGLDDKLLSVPWVLVFAGMFFSTLAGVTTLAMRMMRDLKADTPIGRPVLYCSSHMLGSWCAGAISFLISMQQHAEVWTLLSGVLLASFLGAKGLETLAEMWSRGWMPR